MPQPGFGPVGAFLCGCGGGWRGDYPSVSFADSSPDTRPAGLYIAQPPQSGGS